MLAKVLTLCLAATLGQASPPADTAWLKYVPAEADVVLRGTSLETIRGDFTKMAQAMSPNFGEMVGPVLEGFTGQLTQQYGEDATKTPFLLMMRLPRADAPPNPGTLPPLAAVIKSDDYAGVQKALGGKTVKAKAEAGGFESIPGPDGQPIYTYNAKGYVVLGTDQSLVAAAAKGGGSLDAALKPELKTRLLGGDLGVYVNLKRVVAQYGDQIQALREQLLGAIEKGGQGDADKANAAKGGADRLFDALKNAESLAFHLDFAPEGLNVAGFATPAAGSPAAERLGKGPVGTADRLGRLPADGAYFVYLNLSPEFFERFQQAGMNLMLGAGGKPTPEMKQAFDLQRKAGKQETVSATSIGQGNRTIAFTDVADPKTLVESITAGMKAAPGGSNGTIKDVKVEPDARTYKGYTFNKATMTFDFDKLAKQQPNNARAADVAKAMIGGDTITTWYGTDGKTVITAAAKDWAVAQAQIDAVLSGEGSIGQKPAYKALRSKLPPQVSVLFIASAQGIVRQVAAQLAAAGQGQPKAAADMPAEPALLGGSITNTPAGFRFDGVLPSTVGPILERGLVPILQGGQ